MRKRSVDEGHFRGLAALVAEAETAGVLANARGVMGHSGDSIVGLRQRTVRYQAEGDDHAYLEVEVFQGHTPVSVAVAAPAPGFPVCGIDNFAQFDPRGENGGLLVRRVDENAARDVHLVNADYEDVLSSKPDESKV